MSTVDKINAIIVLVEDVKDGVSNVHDCHHELSSALRHLEEAVKPCQCEYCQQDRKRMKDFVL